MAYQGQFKPKNPSKYKGDPTNIIYRSSWELHFMSYLDGHPDVIEWQSEEFFIPYRSPIDNRIHRYFPDFKVKFRDRTGKTKTTVFEIKPANQSQEPKRQEKVTKKYINEVMTWGKNSSKWKAAEEYCKDRGWEFKVLTEHDLGIKV